MIGGTGIGSFLRSKLLDLDLRPVAEPKLAVFETLAAPGVRVQPVIYAEEMR